MDRCLVLLSTYNGGRFLRELLDSVLAQEQVLIDILVRDDGSNDDTIKILEEYKTKGISYYVGDNIKPAKSFLNLIMVADLQYDYYALCDQDDIWKVDKISAAIKLISVSKKPALYSGSVEVVDKELNYLHTSFNDNWFKSPLYDILMYGTPGCTFVFNKLLLIELKKFKPKTVSMHDSWISFVCLAVSGEFYSDLNAYILYRQHEFNVLGAQKHSLSQTVSGIINFPGVLRSDMSKEILRGYSEYMNEDIKKAFEIFANYKESLPFKIKLLCVKYQSGKATKRAFRKIKLRILFNSL